MVAMGDDKYLLMFTYLNFWNWADLGIAQGAKGNINSVFVMFYETYSLCDMLWLIFILVLWCTVELN